jgi:hypothetical protein
MTRRIIRKESKSKLDEKRKRVSDSIQADEKTIEDLTLKKESLRKDIKDYDKKRDIAKKNSEDAVLKYIEDKRISLEKAEDVRILAEKIKVANEELAEIKLKTNKQEESNRLSLLKNEKRMKEIEAKAQQRVGELQKDEKLLIDSNADLRSKNDQYIESNKSYSRKLNLRKLEIQQKDEKIIDLDKKIADKKAILIEKQEEFNTETKKLKKDRDNLLVSIEKSRSDLETAEKKLIDKSAEVEEKEKELLKKERSFLKIIWKEKFIIEGERILSDYFEQMGRKFSLTQAINGRQSN